MFANYILTVSIIAFDSYEIFAVPIAWKQKRISSSKLTSGIWYFQRTNFTTSHRKRTEEATNYFSSDKLSLKCQEPTNLNQQLMEWYHESTKRQIGTDKISKSSESSSKRSRLWGSLMMESAICRLNPSTDANSDIMERALCPWEWKLNRDESREPKIITEAHCLCRRSRGPSVADCMQIQREFPVLKRIQCDDESGSYQYQKTYETVTVGCHSVMPRIRRAASDWSPKQTDL